MPRVRWIRGRAGSLAVLLQSGDAAVTLQHRSEGPNSTLLAVQSERPKEKDITYALKAYRLGGRAEMG